MTSFQVICHRCGDVSLEGPEALFLWIEVDPNRRARGTFYAFTCPLCGLYSTKACDQRLATILINSGVSSRAWSTPDELHDEVRRGTAPLTADDELDLHLELESLG